MSKVVTANLLLTGHVVFMAPDGTWATAFGDAAIYADQAEAEASLVAAKRDVARSLIVEPFVTDAGPNYTGDKASGPTMSLRDTIRARGPTIDFRPASPAARG